MSAVQSYIRETATHGRDVQRIGPFLATFSTHSASPFLNYAIPDAGARPSKSDVDALTTAYLERNLAPRLEFLTEAAPAVEELLVENGYALERRIPLMVCPPGAVLTQPVPPGIDLRTPRSDAEFSAMISAQNEAYGEPGPVTDEDIRRGHDLLNRGGFAVLASDAVTGERAGGGVGTPLVDHSTELAGFGVRSSYRRRGIGAAMTEFLARAAHQRGGRTVFLTPAGGPEERIYARVGFRPAGEVVHLRFPSLADTVVT